MLNIIHIEPTNRCLLNCECCGDKKTRPIGYMPLNDFRNIAQQAYSLNYNVGVRLFLSGDPLLHPKIGKLCEIAREIGIQDLVIHTSGYALTHKIIKDLIKAELPKISFSLDAYHIRKGDKGTYVGWEALRKVLDFIQYNKRQGKVQVTVQSLARTKAEVAIYQNLHAKHLSQADVSVIKRPHSWTERGSVKGASRVKTKRCKFLADRAAIYWNGDVALCCADLNGFANLGNIFTQDLKLSEVVKLTTKAGSEMAKRRKLPSDFPCHTCERY